MPALNHSFIYSFVHTIFYSFIHSLIHACAQPIIHSLICSYDHLFTRSLIHSLDHTHNIIWWDKYSSHQRPIHSLILLITNSFIHLFIHSLILSFNHSFVRSFIRSIIDSFIYSLARSFAFSCFCLTHLFAFDFLLLSMHYHAIGFIWSSKTPQNVYTVWFFSNATKENLIAQSMTASHW